MLVVSRWDMDRICIETEEGEVEGALECDLKIEQARMLRGRLDEALAEYDRFDAEYLDYVNSCKGNEGTEY